MTLVRWDPFRELMNLTERMGRSEDDNTFGAWRPAVDIYERGEDLMIRAELPGIEKDAIEIRVEDNRLVLRGERKHEEEMTEANTYRMERQYGTFVRSFNLPKTVDAGKIAATYKNGILEIVLPKAEEAKPKKIEIHAA